MNSDELKKLFKNDRFADFIGIEILDAGPGFCRTALKLTERHLNGLDTVQGGVVFTLADLAFAVAVNSHGNKTVGLNAQINWLSPARAGDTIYAEAREIACGRTITHCEVRVTAADDNLMATFHGTGYRKKEVW